MGKSFEFKECERFLKRALKDKGLFTKGAVIAFLITGGIGFVAPPVQAWVSTDPTTGATTDWDDIGKHSVYTADGKKNRRDFLNSIILAPVKNNGVKSETNYEATKSVIVGTDAYAHGTDASVDYNGGSGYKPAAFTAVGNSAHVAGGQGTAIGSNTFAFDQGTAIGNDVYALGASSIAIGNDDITTKYKDKMDIDTLKRLYGDGSSNDVGTGLFKWVNYIKGDGNTASGGKKRLSSWDDFYRSYASTTDSFKYSPTMSAGVGAIAIGSRSLAAKDGATAIGTLSFALGEGSTAMGLRAFTAEDADGAVAIGEKSRSFAKQSLAVGNRNESSDIGAMSYGYNAKALGKGSLAFGYTSYANALIMNTLEPDSDGKNTTNPMRASVRKQLETYTEAQLKELGDYQGKVQAYYEAIQNNASAATIATKKTEMETAKAKVAKFKVSDSNDLNLVKGGFGGGKGTNAVNTAIANYVTSVDSYKDKQALTIEKEAKTYLTTENKDGSTEAVKKSKASGNNAISIGYYTAASGNASVAVGSGSVVDATSGIGIGSLSYVGDVAANSIAFGVGAQVRKENSLALGTQASVYGAGGVGIGSGVRLLGDDSVGIGYGTIVRSRWSVGLGRESSIGYGSMNATAVGTNTKIDENAGNSVALGNSAKIGTEALNSMALGYNSNVGEKSSNSTAIGTNASVINNATSAVALGDSAKVSASSSTALGRLAEASHDNSVALGYRSTTFYFGNPNTREASTSTATSDTNKPGLEIDPYLPPSVSEGIKKKLKALNLGAAGYISVGGWDASVDENGKPLNNDAKLRGLRRIVNVAPGALDTDAVTVAQLREWTDKSAHFLSLAGADQKTADSFANETAPDGTTVVKSNFNNDGASGEHALALGVYAMGAGAGSISIGRSSFGQGTNSTTLGSYGWGRGTEATSIGYRAYSYGEQSVALGTRTVTDSDYGVAIGNRSRSWSEGANGHSGIAIGNKATANYWNALAMGTESKVRGWHSTAIGAGAQVGMPEVFNDDGVSMNVFKADGKSYNKANQVVYEKTGETNTEYTVKEYRPGTTTVVKTFTIQKPSTIHNALAFGHEASVTNDRVTDAKDATRINEFSSAGSIAIGTSASVKGSQNSVALGLNSKVVRTDTETESTSAFTGDKNNDPGNGVVSIGNSNGVTRRIIHVAGGANDDDAVNVKQLKQAVKYYKTNSTETAARTVNDIADVSANYNGEGATGTASVALGSYTQAGGAYSVALGRDVITSGNTAVGLGTNVTSSGHSSVGIGFFSNAAGNDSVALGHSAITGFKTTEEITNPPAGGPTTRTVVKGVNEGVAIGNSSAVESNYAVAIGGNAKVTRDASDATKIKDSESSVAIGASAKVEAAKYSVALGLNSKVKNAESSVAIGNNANVEDAKYSVALGMNSMVTADDVKYHPTTEGKTKESPYLLTADVDKMRDADNGVVAVGRKRTSDDGSSLARRIVGVAGGYNDYDAVNVKQLKAAAWGLQVQNGTATATDVTLGGTGDLKKITLKAGNNVTLDNTNGVVTINASGGLNSITSDKTDVLGVTTTNGAVTITPKLAGSVSNTDDANKLVTAGVVNTAIGNIPVTTFKADAGGSAANTEGTFTPTTSKKEINITGAGKNGTEKQTWTQGTKRFYSDNIGTYLNSDGRVLVGLNDELSVKNITTYKYGTDGKRTTNAGVSLTTAGLVGNGTDALTISNGDYAKITVNKGTSATDKGSIHVNGSTLTGLADGNIAANSTDAVTGGQLHTKLAEKADKSEITTINAALGKKANASDLAAKANTSDLAGKLDKTAERHVKSGSFDATNGTITLTMADGDGTVKADAAVTISGIPTKLGYKAETEAAKSVAVTTGLTFKAGTGTIAPTNLAPTAESPTKTTDNVTTKKGIVISTENGGVVNIGLDEATRKVIDQAAKIGDTAVDGRDGKPANGKTGTAGNAGDHGLTGADGLNGKDLTNKVNALRNGEAGTVVYTDDQGNRLAKANDGNYYLAGKVNADGTKADDAVAVTNLQARIVNPDGTTTTATGKTGTVLSNIANGKIADKSTDAVTGGQLYTAKAELAKALGGNAGVDANGALTGPTYSITKDDAAGGTDTVNNVGAAVDKLDARINTVKGMAAQPLTFTGDSGSVTRKLGETLTVKGAKNFTPATDATVGVNIRVEKDPTTDANGLVVKLADTLTGMKGITGTGKDNLVIKNGDTTITIGKGTPAQGTTAAVPGPVNFGGAKLTNIGDANADTDATNKKYVDDKVAGLNLGYKAETEAAKSVAVTTGLTFKAGTGTIAPTNLAPTAESPTKTTDTVTTKKGIVISTEKDGVVNIGLDEATRKVIDQAAKIGDTAVDGRDGKAGTGKPANDVAATAGDHGLTGADGLNGKDLTNKVNALRNGEAGTVVYTDDQGNRLVKANDGNYYPAGKVNADGTKADDAVAVANPQARLVNPDGSTTIATGKTGTVLSNIGNGSIADKSTDAVTGGQLYTAKKELATALGGDAKVGTDGTLTGPTYSITKDDGTNGKETVNNVGAAVTKLDARINTVKESAAKPLTFTGDDGQGVERKLDTTLTVKGAANFTPTATNPTTAVGVNIRVEKDSTANANGLVVKLADTLTGMKGITGNGTDPLTIKNGDTTITVKPSKPKDGDKPAEPSTVDFGGAKLTNIGEANADSDATNKKYVDTKVSSIQLGYKAETEAAKSVAVTTGLTFKAGTGTIVPTNLAPTAESPTKTTDTVTTKKGIVISTEKDGVVNIGLDEATRKVIDQAAKIGDTAVDGRDGKPGNGKTGTDGNAGDHGLTGADGLNGKDLTNKVNALRNGEAGTVVYTDDQGNRLVKANDGNYYPANKVNADGTKADDAVAVKTPQARLVNPDGSTTTATGTTGTVLSNIANGKIADKSTDAVTGGQLYKAKQELATALGGNAGVDTNGALTKPTYSITKDDATGTDTVNNVGAAVTKLDTRINALKNSQLTFTGDSGSVTRKLGETLTVKGANNFTPATDATAGVNIRVEKDATENANGLVVKLADTLTNMKGISGNGKDPVVIQNGDQSITITPTTAAETSPDGTVTKPAQVGKIDFGNSKLISSATPKEKNDLVNKGYLEKAIADVNKVATGNASLGYKANTETAKSVNVNTGLHFKSGTGTINATGTDATTTNAATTKTGIAISTEDNGVVNIGLDANTRTAIDKVATLETAVGNSGADGRDGKPGTGTNAGIGKDGLTAEDGLNGKDLTSKVNALRSGEAGSVVYTDDQGKRVVKATDGKWYPADKVKADGTKADDAVEVKTPQARIVNPNGTTTGGTTVFNNVASAIPAAAADGAKPTFLDNLNTAANSEKTKHAAVNVSDLNSTAKDIVAKGLTFQGNDQQGIKKQLGETLHIVGEGTLATTTTTAANNIRTKKTNDGKLEIGLAKDLVGITSITNGDTTITVKPSKPKDGDKPAEASSVDFGGAKLTNIGDANADTDATNKKYVDDKVAGLKLGYKAETEAAKSVAVTTGLTFKAGAGTIAPTNLAPTAESPTKTTDTVTTKKGIVISTENDGVVNIGLDEATRKVIDNAAKIGDTAVDGRDGKPGNGKTGTAGNAGDHGLTGADGLNGKDLTNKVNALRNGEAGTVVYTDDQGNRLVKANDGNYYRAEAVDAKGALKDAAQLPEGVTLTPVTNPQARLVNADGTTTTATGKTGTVLSNIANGKIADKSTDAVTGGQLYTAKSELAKALGGNAGVDANGVLTNPTYSITKDNATGGTDTVNNVGAAVTKLDERITAARAYTDTKVGAAKTELTTSGLDFKGDDTTAVHRNLGTELTIKGANNFTPATDATAGVNIRVEKDPTTNANGLVVKLADTLTGMKGITGTGKDDLVIKNGDTTITIGKGTPAQGTTAAVPGPVNFGGATLTNVGDANADSDVTNKKYVDNKVSGIQLGYKAETEAAKSVSVTTGLTFKAGTGTIAPTNLVPTAESPTKTTDTVTTKKGIVISTEKDGVVNIGLDEATRKVIDQAAKIGDTAVDGRDGKPGTGTTAGMGKDGVTGKDGLNGTDLTTKVNALRNGEAGSVVYTDADGNRLVRATDGKWYPADKVKADGTVKTVGEEGITTAPVGIEADKVIASLVSPNGTTAPKADDATKKAMTKLSNIAEGTISDKSNDAVTGRQLYAAKQEVGDIIGGTTIGTNGKITGPTFTITKADGTNETTGTIKGAIEKLNTTNVDQNTKISSLISAVDKSITFVGDHDTNDKITRKLGDTLNIKGQNNITVTKATGTDSTLNVSLSSTLKNITSISSGVGTDKPGSTITLGADGVTFTNVQPGTDTTAGATSTVKISKDGIDAGTMKITNVAKATANGDAANKEYVDEAISKVNNAVAGNATLNFAGNVTKDEHDADVAKVGLPLSTGVLKVQGNDDTKDIVTTAKGDTITIGLHKDVKDQLAKLGNTAADGRDGKPGTGTTAGMGKDGLTAADGLNGKDLTNKVNALRNGEAGTVVYTDDKGNRLVKANDGNYYPAGKVNADGTKADDAVAVTNPQARLVNPDGTTTTATGKTGTVLSNIANGKIADKSTDAVTGGQLYTAKSELAKALGGNAGVDANGALTNPTYSITKDDATGTDTVSNVGAAVTKLDTRINALKNSQLTFTGDSGSVTRKLGETLTVKGANNFTPATDATAGVNIRVEKDSTTDANGLVVKLADTLTGMKGISGNGTDPLTIKNGDATITVKASKPKDGDKPAEPSTVDFGGAKLSNVGEAKDGTDAVNKAYVDSKIGGVAEIGYKADTETDTKKVAVSTGLTFKAGTGTIAPTNLAPTAESPTKTTDTVTTKKGIVISTENDGVVNIGLDEATRKVIDNAAKIGDTAVDGRDGKPANGKTGTAGNAGDHGLTGADGLNGKDLTNKVNALRNGEAGTVVYTDDQGNRLVKANDGNYYPAGKVNADGTRADDAVAVTNPQARLVNPDGSTTIATGKTGTVFNNVASSIANVEAKDAQNQPITSPSYLERLNTAAGDAKTQYAAVNVSDLNNTATEIVAKGLTFQGNDGSAITKALGTTLDIVGEGTVPATTTTAVNNIRTKKNSDGKLEIGLAKDLVGITSITNETDVTKPSTKVEIGKDGITVTNIQPADATAGTAATTSKVTVGKDGVKVGDKVTINTSGMSGNGTDLLTIKNGDATITVKPSKPKDGDKPAEPSTVDFGGAKLSNVGEAKDGTDAVNKAYVDSKIGGVAEIGYKADTETDTKKVAVSTGLTFKAGTGTIAPTNLAPAAESPTKTTDTVKTKKGIVISTENDGVVNIGLDEATRKVIDQAAKIGDTAVDGRDGKAGTGKPANDAAATAGDKGLTGADGLNGKDLTNKVNALRNGEAGTVVYTDENGNRLAKANDGNYYLAGKVNADGTKADDAVAVANPQARLVNPDGSTTIATGKTGTVLSNIGNGSIADKSTDAVTGGQLYTAKKELATALGGDAKVGTDGTLTGPTYSITKDDGTNGKETVNNVGAAIGKLDTRINTVKESAAKPLTFTGDDGQGVERKLDTILTVKGAANFTPTATNTTTAAGVNIRVEKDPTTNANGLVVKLADTLTGMKGITGNGTDPLVIKNGDATITVKPSKPKDGDKPAVPSTVDFGGAKLSNIGEANADTDATNKKYVDDKVAGLNLGYKAETEAAKSVSVTTGLTFKAGTGTIAPTNLAPTAESPTKTTDTVTTKKGIVISTEKDGVVNIGLDEATRKVIDQAAKIGDTAVDGRDGKPANGKTGTDGNAGDHGLTGADGLNGMDLTSKVNALRNGESGTVVYTDDKGNRLVKANDGKYYRAEAVDAKGALKDASQLPEGVTLDPVTNPQGRLVNPNGTTTGGTTVFNNVASAIANTVVKDTQNQPIANAPFLDRLKKTAADAQLQNAAVNVSDLNSTATDIIAKGLTFQGNDAQDIKKQLGETLHIVGEGTLATGATTAVNNIRTKKTDDGKLEIGLAKDLVGITSITNETDVTKPSTKVEIGKDGITVTNTQPADATAGTVATTSKVTVGKDGVKVGDKVTINTSGMSGNGTEPLTIKNGDTTITVKPSKPKDGDKPAEPSTVDFGGAKLSNVGEAKADTDATNKAYVDSKVGAVSKLGYKANTETETKKVGVADGLYFKSGTGTIDATGTGADVTNAATTKTGIAISTEENGVVNIGLDEATRKVIDQAAKLGDTSIDGRDGKPGTGNNPGMGHDGVTGQDGLNGADLTTKVNALRNGEAGSVVYTDADGNRLVRATDGKFYKASEVKPDGTVKAVGEDGITKAPVGLEADKVIASLVSPDGATAPKADDADKKAMTKLSNIAEGAITATSNDAVTGRQVYKAKQELAAALGGNAGVGTDGTWTKPTYTITNDSGATPHTVDNVGSAVTKLDERITDARTYTDTKVSAANTAGMNFVGDDTASVHRNLGDTLTVKGANNFTPATDATAGVNIRVEKDPTEKANGLVVKLADTLTNMKGISGDGEHDLVIKNGTNTITMTAGTAEVKDDAGVVTKKANPGTVNFGDATVTVKNLDASITYRANGATGTDIRTVKLKDGFNFVAGTGTIAATGATSATTNAETTKKGITITTGENGAVTIGLDAETRKTIDNAGKIGNTASDGRDGKTADGTGGAAGDKGLTGKDGLNGTDLTTKVNALRNGEAGTVVYTDETGSRLVKANDGKYYKANEVDKDGNVITPTGGTTPTAATTVEARLVNPDGTTVTATVFNNVASSIANVEVKDAQNKAVAKPTFLDRLHTAATIEISKLGVVNVKDLYDASKEIVDLGLDFYGNDETEATGKVHRNLGTTVKIQGAGTFKRDADKTNNINVKRNTAQDGFTVELAENLVGMKEIAGTGTDPLTIKNGDTTITVKPSKAAEGNKPAEASSVDFGGAKVTNVGEAKADTDATNKKYVDDKVNALRNGEVGPVVYTDDQGNHLVKANDGKYYKATDVNPNGTVKTAAEAGTTEAPKAVAKPEARLVSPDGSTTGAATKLSNIAEGEITATSKDAVTGKQLHATNERVATLEKALDGKADKSTVEALSKQVESKADASTVKALADTVAKKADKTDLDKKADKSEVSALANKAMTFTGNKADETVERKLGETLHLEGKNNITVVKDAKKTDTLHVTMASDLTGITSITGLTDTAWDPTKVATADEAKANPTSESAVARSSVATKGQLKDVADHVAKGRMFTADTVKDGKPVEATIGLGDVLAIQGGADTAKLTDKNIGVELKAAETKDGKIITPATMTVKLAKDVKMADGTTSYDRYVPEYKKDDKGKVVFDTYGEPTILTEADGKTPKLQKDKDGNPYVLTKTVVDGKGTTYHSHNLDLTGKVQVDSQGNPVSALVTTVTAEGSKYELRHIGKDSLVQVDAQGHPIVDVTTVVTNKGIQITPGEHFQKAPVSLSANGLNNGGNTISNVAPGVYESDAATVGQVRLATNTVTEQVNKAGAHAAALAAMNPLTYDPLKKSQVMAGVGTYKGNQALALGVAHYANEDTMVNVGLSLGGGDNMMNAGVTYRFGGEDSMIPERYKGGPISSIYVMQDEISALKAENAEVKAENAQIKADNSQVRADNERMKASYEKIMEDNAQMKQDNEEMKAQIKMLMAHMGIR